MKPWNASNSSVVVVGLLLIMQISKLFHWKATPTRAFNEFLYEFSRIFPISENSLKFAHFFCWGNEFSIYDLHGFSGPFGLKWGFWGQNRRRGGALLTPNEHVLTFGGSYVRANFGENRSRMRPWECSRTERQTHWQTQSDFIICPMLCAIAVGQIISLTTILQSGFPFCSANRRSHISKTWRLTSTVKWWKQRADSG